MGELDQWKCCPRCREELEREDGKVECPACGFRTYASSKPTASALCLDDDGGILLARRAGEPFKGYRDLPGGFLEEGEHPLDAIRREVREETSLEVEPEEFIGVWIDRYGSEPDSPSTLNLYWTARVVSGEPEAADDVSEVAWFSPDELPPADEFAFHVAEVLAAWREKYA
jgi:ADP-ribose pyrophosphatase YjhB (NUDIX family)